MLRCKTRTSSVCTEHKIWRKVKSKLKKQNLGNMGIWVVGDVKEALKNSFLATTTKDIKIQASFLNNAIIW